MGDEPLHGSGYRIQTFVYKACFFCYSISSAPSPPCMSDFNFESKMFFY